MRLRARITRTEKLDIYNINFILFQNENRSKLLLSLEENKCSLFTGTIKMSTIGSFGEYYVRTQHYETCSETQYLQEDSEEGETLMTQDDEIPFHPGYSRQVTSASVCGEQEDDAVSVKSC